MQKLLRGQKVTLSDGRECWVCEHIKARSVIRVVNPKQMLETVWEKNIKLIDGKAV